MFLLKEIYRRVEKKVSGGTILQSILDNISKKSFGSDLYTEQVSMNQIYVGKKVFSFLGAFQMGPCC